MSRMRKNEIVMSFGFCVIGGLEFEWMQKMQARTAPKGQTSKMQFPNVLL